MIVTMPTWATVCHPNAHTSHSQPVYKIWQFKHHPLQRYDWSPKNWKKNSV